MRNNESAHVGAAALLGSWPEASALLPQSTQPPPNPWVSRKCCLRFYLWDSRTLLKQDPVSGPFSAASWGNTSSRRLTNSTRAMIPLELRPPAGPNENSGTFFCSCEGVSRLPSTAWYSSEAIMGSNPFFDFKELTHLGGFWETEASSQSSSASETCGGGASANKVSRALIWSVAKLNLLGM